MRYLQRAGFSPDAKRTLQGSCYDCTGQGRTRKRKVGGGSQWGAQRSLAGLSSSRLLVTV